LCWADCQITLLTETCSQSLAWLLSNYLLDRVSRWLPHQAEEISAKAPRTCGACLESCVVATRSKQVWRPSCFKTTKRNTQTANCRPCRQPREAAVVIVADPSKVNVHTSESIMTTRPSRCNAKQSLHSEAGSCAPVPRLAAICFRINPCRTASTPLRQDRALH